MKAIITKIKTLYVNYLERRTFRRIDRIMKSVEQADKRSGKKKLKSFERFLDEL